MLSWLKIYFFVTKAATIAHLNFQARAMDIVVLGENEKLLLKMEIVVLGLTFVVQYWSVIVSSADHELQQRYACVNQTFSDLPLKILAKF